MECSIPYEQLAALAAADPAPAEVPTLAAHAAGCASCQRRLAALSITDKLLRQMGETPAPTGVAERVVAALRTQVSLGPEVLTLDEVARFLRLTPDGLSEVVEELPAFELAGQVRVRRDRLVRWIEQREQSYTRQVMQSRFSRAVRGEARGVA